MIEVLAPGPLTLVEDLGRPGWASVGVGRSGAADRGALRLANRLLANPDGAAALEVMLGGLHVRFVDRATFTLTGADVPATVDGVPVGMGAVLEASAGTQLRLGTPLRGLRTYLGVRGGIDVAPTLGSRSYDVLAALGPAPVVAGEMLAIGPQPAEQPVVDQMPWTDPGASRADVPLRLEVAPGPRDGWFSWESWQTLCSTAFTVSAHSNRAALRLDGAAIPRAPGEVPSEGLVPGAIQVPPDGLPVLFLTDHPVTGGYPVIAVVHREGVDRAAQLRPGDGVRFRRRTVR